MRSVLRKVIGMAIAGVGIWGVGLTGHSAQAMELDWAGQFRAESHWIHNYSMDADNTVTDPNRVAAKGYYIPGGGSTTANFQTLFLKLKPKLVVNDNIYIKSEWWVGDPIYGFYGNAFPSQTDQRQYYSTQSRGSAISAQRYWAEFLSDIGTVQVGRAPLHWGLGIVWNAGDGLWDHYESTGDVIRLIAKFGAFSFIPGIIKYSTGNDLGGSCVAGVNGCVATIGGGGVSDYSLMLKYENPDEEFEGGINFVKRLAGPAQDTSGILGVNQVPSGMNYNIFDIYGQKKFGKFTLGGEVPVTSGDIGGIPYKTFAVALEGDYRFSDTWDTGFKAGHAPGEPDLSGSTTPQNYRAFYFNPNYKIALIMFNYNLSSFAGPNTQNNPNTQAQNLVSPYDNPISNANYLSWNGALQSGKWNLHTAWTYAQARETAVPGQAFYNSQKRQYVMNNTNTSQGTALGWEMDYGTTYQWDDSFQFKFDFGAYFPGSYYQFSNLTGTPNATSAITAAVFRAGVVF